MSEQQPELRWAPIPPAPNRHGRAWLITGVSLAVVLIAAVLLFFLIPRSGEPEPGASASPSPHASSTTTASPSPSASPTPTPTPTTVTPSEPAATPPPPVDPSLAAFRGQVGGWLSDAPRGLDLVASTSGQDSISVIDTLREDAQRLSDAQPPSSIASQWRDGVSSYAQTLTDLRAAVSSGASTSEALEAARTSVHDLSKLIGL